ncbi:MAG: adenylate kinase [Gammaproteobacteria bacterium]|nr:adenylate kinase [Gammaproteobacteria bacterium]
MRIVLLGAPGSGKGTQANLLGQRLGIPQVSTGDLLRDALASGSELGRRAKEAMNAGKLVSDEIVLKIIKERLGMDDAASGFVLDGFPRNVAQAKALDKLLKKIDRPLHKAVLLEIDDDILLQRLTGRLTCPECGRVYNLYTNPPKIDEQCDRDGSDLIQRSDDKQATIENRLRVYRAQTAPVADFYAREDKLATVDAEGEIDEIAGRMRTALNA